MYVRKRLLNCNVLHVHVHRRLVQVLDRQHYLDCNCDGTKRVHVEEVGGRLTYIAKRKGRACFGCSKHCSTMGHKVEIRSRKGASSLSKSFTNFHCRPCRKLRASSLKSCQRHCRLDRGGCNGYLGTSLSNIAGVRFYPDCTLCRGQPKSSSPLFCGKTRALTCCSSADLDSRILYISASGVSCTT